MQLGLSTLICDRGPTDVHKIVRDIINMDGYVREGQFTMVHAPIPIRVDPGFNGTMPVAIRHTSSQDVMQRGEKYQSDSRDRD